MEMPAEIAGLTVKLAVRLLVVPREFVIVTAYGEQLCAHILRIRLRKENSVASHFDLARAPRRAAVVDPITPRNRNQGAGWIIKGIGKENTGVGKWPNEGQPGSGKK